MEDTDRVSSVFIMTLEEVAIIFIIEHFTSTKGKVIGSH